MQRKVTSPKLTSRKYAIASSALSPMAHISNELGVCKQDVGIISKLNRHEEYLRILETRLIAITTAGYQ